MRLRRVKGNFAVVLEDQPDPQAAGNRATADARAHRLDLSLGELTALLDAAPASRRPLRYLADG